MLETITIVEAAQMLGIHRDTVRELVKKGELKGHKKTLTKTSPFVVDRDTGPLKRIGSVGAPPIPCLAVFVSELVPHFNK